MLQFLVLALLLNPLCGETIPTNSPPSAGARIAFLGDSITQFGWGNRSGYVHLVEIAFAQQGRPIVVIPAGVNGNTSTDMLARLQTDVLDKKPNWMTISAGPNDVGSPSKGVPLEQYEANIASMVDQATASGIKVLLFTSTMVTEDGRNPYNLKLAGYNDFLRRLARDRKLPLADMYEAMFARLGSLGNQKGYVGRQLTIDGVHMNGLGDELMATEVLRAFDFSDSQIAQAREKWVDIPGAMTLHPQAGVSVRQYQELRELAARQGISVDELLGRALPNDVQATLGGRR